MIKKLVLSMFIIIASLSVHTYGQSSSWTIIPETSSGGKASGAVQDVGKEPGKVWETYNEKAKDMDVGDSFASGIFTWDTILEFLKHIANVLSQIGLVIGAGMIIYAGYKYATGVFTGDPSKGGKDAVKGAIYGVLIVIFSYAIMNILLGMFW